MAGVRMIPPARMPGRWRMLADTATVGGWTAAIKVAGAIKVILAARLFGAGDAMDAYLIAFLLPSFFADVLAGPLEPALIPALVELRTKQGVAAAQALASAVLGAAGVALLGVALVVAFTANLFLPLVASSFSPDKLALTGRLLLCMIAILPLSALSVTWRAILNSAHRFAMAAFIPMVTPVVSIAALLLFGRQYGVAALAAGSVIGAALEAVLSGAGVKFSGGALLPHWSGATPALREVAGQVAGQYAPLVAITLVMSGSALVDQGLAARLGSGSVATLNYGTRLLGVLIAIGPVAAGTVVLPHISGRMAVSESGGVGRVLRNYTLSVLALVLPLVGVLMYFSEPIIRLLFRQSAFSESSTHLVAMVQSAALLQVPAALVLALQIRFTSAMKATRVLYRTATLTLALTLVLDLLLMRWQGVVGIALAGAVAKLVSALYLCCKISGLRAKGAGFDGVERVS